MGRQALVSFTMVSVGYKAKLWESLGKKPNRLRHKTRILKAAGFLTAADDPAPKQTNYFVRKVVQPAPFQLQKANTISSYSF